MPRSSLRLKTAASKEGDSVALRTIEFGRRTVPQKCPASKRLSFPSLSAEVRSQAPPPAARASSSSSLPWQPRGTGAGEGAAMPDWAAGALNLSAVALAVLLWWFWLYGAAFPLVVLSALLLTSVLLLFCDVCLLPRRQPSPPPPRPRPRPAQRTSVAMAEVAQMARGLVQLARQAAQALEEEQQEAIAEEEAYAHEE